MFRLFQSLQEDRGLPSDPAWARGVLPTSRGRDGVAPDPRHNEQPGRVRLSARVGDGKPGVPTECNPKRIRRVMRMNGLMLPPRVHRRQGRPHLCQVQQPASNQRFCSDIFQIPCWSGEVVSVGFVIDCHDREVLAHVAAPRSLTGADIRTLMERSLWKRFEEATLKTPHAIQ